MPGSASDRDDVWTLFHSYAFDFSVWEMWGALLYGGRLVVVPYWDSRDPAGVPRAAAASERVTVLNQTPSAFRQLIAGRSAEAPRRPRAALRHLRRRGAGAAEPAARGSSATAIAHPRLINMYGITETTVHVTYRPITLADLDADAGSVIGVPIPDLHVHLLDAHGAAGAGRRAGRDLRRRRRRRARAI